MPTANLLTRAREAVTAHEVAERLWARGIKVPVTDPADLDALDEDEIVAGYRSAAKDDPEPGGNHSRAFWHGWRNGMSDRRFREPDAAQRELARRLHERGDYARMSVRIFGAGQNGGEVGNG